MAQNAARLSAREILTLVSGTAGSQADLSRAAIYIFKMRGDLVDVRGLEPLTSSLRTRRSPN
jgi:hypothetical protein